MISLEAVIEQQYPGLQQRKPLIGKTLLQFLRYICHESEFKQFAQTYPHVEGFDFVEQVLDYFDFTFRLKDNQRVRIPAQGRVVIIANHPIGSLDGLALLKMVGEIRRDVKAVANEILYALEPLRSLLLPVDNMGRRSGKEQLRAIRNHLNNEGAIIIFPAGEVSRVGPKGIRDGRWSNGFLRFANATNSPILPVFVDGRNSVFFYALSLLVKPISTLWLIREMFKQAKNHVDINVGQIITPEQYQGLDITPKAQAKLFKNHVYRLRKKHQRRSYFAVECEAIAHPEHRQLLRAEVVQSELLGSTKDGKAIYLYSCASSSAVMREIGRLREMSFRAVKEGTGKRRDLDAFDRYYDHLVLWDDKELEIVGAYRMVRSQYALENSKHKPELYTKTLFEFAPEFDQYFSQGLELGRSFVQPKYWGKRSIDYLWQGIGAYLTKYPDLRYLYGPVSISHQYPDAAKNLLISFYRHYFGGPQNLVKAIMPYDAPELMAVDLALEFCGNNYQQDFCQLKKILAQMGCAVPTLYKQYTEFCEDQGAHFLAFNVDRDFADCVDGLILVDLYRTKEDRRNRYMSALTKSLSATEQFGSEKSTTVTIPIQPSERNSYSPNEAA